MTGIPGDSIRGSLPVAGAGARGIEHAARNRRCLCLKAILYAGTVPAVVVDSVFPRLVYDGQSPFAIDAGNRFETWMTEGGAERLLSLYNRTDPSHPEGPLPPEDQLPPGCHVLDLGAEFPMPTRPPFVTKALLTSDPKYKKFRDDLRRACDARIAATERCFALKAAGDREAPEVILKGRFRIQVCGRWQEIEVDALRGFPLNPFYRPVELKSYPDRAGKTSPADIRAACRQSAVYVVGLRRYLYSQGLDPALVAPVADLVLKLPGYMAGSLRTMTLRNELESVERLLDEPSSVLAEIESRLNGLTLDSEAGLDSLPIHYMPSCKEHCPLASRCRSRARACGTPAILGTAAQQSLEVVGDLHRASSLMRGMAVPTAEESIITRRLAAARAVLEGFNYV